MIGLARGIVQIVPYEETWPALFCQEAERLRFELGRAIGAIEHVGSTAVPGLSAKPIIDMMAAVVSLPAARELIPPLEQIGYEHRPDDTVPGRLFFAYGPHSSRSYHLSLTEPDSSFWREHICFRDYLRNHPSEAADYAQLKQRLAVRFADDRNGYTAAKTEFITRILEAEDEPITASRLASVLDRPNPGLLSLREAGRGPRSR